MIIVPKLELKKKSDIELDEYAEDRNADLATNPDFPVTDPLVADVEAKRVLFRNAIIAAIEGTKAKTQTKNQLRRELSLMLTNLADDVAKKSNGDLAKYLSSGFSAKKVATPTGQPAAPLNFLLKFTKNDNEGELLATWKKVESAKIYQVMIGTSPTPPASPGSGTNPGTPTSGPMPVPGNDWRLAGETTAARLVIQNLVSGTKYYARVRAIGTKGVSSPWSDIAAKICP